MFNVQRKVLAVFCVRNFLTTATIPSPKVGKHYRFGVGILLFNRAGEVLVARKAGDAQQEEQFLQGGIDAFTPSWRCLRGSSSRSHYTAWWRESAGRALFRELGEEIGLPPEEVRVIGRSAGLKYWMFPDEHTRYCGKAYVWFAAVAVGDALQTNESIQAYLDCHNGRLAKEDKEVELASVRWVNLAGFVKTVDGSLPWAGVCQGLAEEYGSIPSCLSGGRVPEALSPYRGWVPGWIHPVFS